MKSIKILPKTILCSLLLFSFTQVASSQFLKKLGERAEKAAERTIENRVDREASKKTDKALDEVLEPGKKDKDSKKKKEQAETPAKSPSNTPESPATTPDPKENTASGNATKAITVYSKFDFVPGDKLLFFDDFSNDFVGDFPAKWNTNGTGEVVTMNDSPDKWFEMKSGSNIAYIPDVSKLPEEYTIEFDLMTIGMSSHTSVGTHLKIIIGENNSFESDKNQVYVQIPFCQYTPGGIRTGNYINGKNEISSTINADIRKQVLERPHISIAVNKQRYRLWVNETKYLDIPRMVPVDKNLSSLKFIASSLKDNKERVFLGNLKVAEGGEDLRRTLIASGKVSTNGILFDSGSANIQPQSMGIILQISQVLQQEKDLNLKIVGHTDADGNDQSNLELSKKRAEAVKSALTSVYNIAPDRLQTDGKGESEPVGDNATPDGKSQNRRVEFVKI